MRIARPVVWPLPRAVRTPLVRVWQAATLRRAPQEALLQLPPAEDSLQSSEAGAHVQLRVGPEEEAQLLLEAATPSAITAAAPTGGVYATGQGGVAPSGQTVLLLRASTAPSDLRCWPACLPGCEARDLDRLGPCRDDPGDRPGRRSSSGPRSLDDPRQRPALATPSGN